MFVLLVKVIPIFTHLDCIICVAKGQDLGPHQSLTFLYYTTFNDHQKLSHIFTENQHLNEAEPMI